ncbi:MAG: universal stress protein [Bdellovibrio sp.]|nr:universal stress protein [Bdellovibrio sp.]
MKALWALEPFHQKPLGIKSMYNLLKQLVGPASNIEVGFIVTRSEPELYLAYDIPAKARFTSYPRKLLKDTLKKAQIPIEDKKVHLIDFDTLSNTAAVDRFLALANSRDVDLIALYTHAYRGYKRFALGSFAETAIHRSKINLLLINPLVKNSLKIRNILFSCDFLQGSKRHILRAIEICKKAKSSLTVLHVAEVMYRWSLDESNPKIHDYRKNVRRMCEWIENECKKSKIICEITVTTEIKPMTDLVLNTANSKKADLIIVAAKVGRIGALMGGSTTRKLIRSSTRPVLVFK